MGGADTDVSAPVPYISTVRILREASSKHPISTGQPPCSGSPGPTLEDSVTEIPEHLLARSKARRGEAAAAPSAPAASSAPAVAESAAPAKAAAATPAVPAAPPVKPVPAHVAAANSRQKIPFWALPVLILLPLFAFVYFDTMKPRTIEVTGPLAEGELIYNNCAGCHGGAGGGGAGRKLNDGEVLLTFPRFEDQYTYVINGSVSQGQPYGDPNRPGGTRLAIGGMSGWGAADGSEGSLTSYELMAVICHERFSMQNIDGAVEGPWAEQYSEFCSPESAVYEAAEANPTIYSISELKRLGAALEG
jgi:hypothetical protein